MSVAKTVTNPSFELSNKGVLDRVIALQKKQHTRSPYGNVDPNEFLFGKDHRRIAERFAAKGKKAGEVGEYYEQALNPDAKKADVIDEFGDFLWQVINTGIKNGIDVKDALIKATNKRLARLKKVVQFANERAQQISKDMPIDEWLKLWDEAKAALKDPQRMFDFDRRAKASGQMFLSFPESK